MSGKAGNGHRIAVISDTHNMFRPEVAEVIRTCEAVLHGGDISGPTTLDKIRNLCEECLPGGAQSLYVVRGNNDRDWAADIPYSLEITLCGRKIFMTHKKRDIPADVEADVVIYGHSHRYAQEFIGKTLYLNPGSCGPRRFNQAITMAVLTISETGIDAERIEIPHEAGRVPVIKDREQVSGDLIRWIGLDIRKHRTVAEIAARRNISPALAEEIVRLYVTHPGVTPEQVMSKMGL